MSMLFTETREFTLSSSIIHSEIDVWITFFFFTRDPRFSDGGTSLFHLLITFPLTELNNKSSTYSGDPLDRV